MGTQQRHIYTCTGLYPFYSVIYSFFLSAIVCPWLNFGLPPRCLQFVWCQRVWCEGRLSHFLPRWLRTGWQSAIYSWMIYNYGIVGVAQWLVCLA